MYESDRSPWSRSVWRDARWAHGAPASRHGVRRGVEGRCGVVVAVVMTRQVTSRQGSGHGPVPEGSGSTRTRPVGPRRSGRRTRCAATARAQRPRKAPRLSPRRPTARRGPAASGTPLVRALAPPLDPIRIIEQSRRVGIREARVVQEKRQVPVAVCETDDLSAHGHAPAARGHPVYDDRCVCHPSSVRRIAHSGTPGPPDRERPGRGARTGRRRARSAALRIRLTGQARHPGPRRPSVAGPSGAVRVDAGEAGRGDAETSPTRAGTRRRYATAIGSGAVVRCRAGRCCPGCRAVMAGRTSLVTANAARVPASSLPSLQSRWVLPRA